MLCYVITSISHGVGNSKTIICNLPVDIFIHKCNIVIILLTVKYIFTLNSSVFSFMVLHPLC